MRSLLAVYHKKGLNVQERVSLAPRTTLRVGGEARLLVEPRHYHEVMLAVDIAKEAGVPVLLLGGGSNLLVRDGGFPGVVVSLRRLTRLRYLGAGVVEAEAGVSLGALLRLALREGLRGLEFLAGVPATIGGLVAMNAGAFGHEIKDFLKEIVILDRGQRKILSPADLAFTYRSWGGPEGAVILKVKLVLQPATKQDVEAKLQDYLHKRRKTQPLGESTSGCVFKNPEGFAAGFLIEQVGLKGYTRGRAAFSKKHANFIVTRAGAKASDVLALIDQAKEEVLKAFGLTLAEEVVIVGEA